MPYHRHLIKLRGSHTFGDYLADIGRLAYDWFTFAVKIFCFVAFFGVVLGYDDCHRFTYWICELISESIKR